MQGKHARLALARIFICSNRCSQPIGHHLTLVVRGVSLLVSASPGRGSCQHGLMGGSTPRCNSMKASSALVHVDESAYNSTLRERERDFVSAILSFSDWGIIRSRKKCSEILKTGCRERRHSRLHLRPEEPISFPGGLPTSLVKSSSPKCGRLAIVVHMYVGKYI